MRVQQRRDDEGDRTERLHHDKRRERQRAELADDREPEHDRARDPRGPTEQSTELTERQSARAIAAAQRLDFDDAAVLQLRAERHEYCARERERDPQQQGRVLKDADELIAEVADTHGHAYRRC